MEALLKKLKAETGLSDQELERLVNAAKNGATLAEMFEMPKKSLESLATYATNLYTAQNYHEAELLFRALCLWQEEDAQPWLGLGRCLYQQGYYIDSTKCFARAFDLQHSTLALYLIALSLTKLQDFSAARAILELAPDVATPHDPYAKEVADLLAKLPREE